MELQYRNLTPRPVGSQVRAATPSDAEALLNIYSPYVVNSPVSFELELPAVKEFERRIAEILEKYPYIVLELQREILGYAYAGSFRTRGAYAWTLESTVYVRQGFHGMGIGKILYGRLLEILKNQGVVNVIGGITLPNAGSVKLHEYFGFKKVALIQNAGFKIGRWWDVGYWQLQLQKPAVPAPLFEPAID